MIGPRPTTRSQLMDPTGARFGIPTYPWGFAPKELMTRRQLRAIGKQPNGQKPCAQMLRWRRRREPLCAYLFDPDLAADRLPPNEGRRRGLARGRLEMSLRAAERHGIPRAELLDALAEAVLAAENQVLPEVAVLPTDLPTPPPCRTGDQTRDARTVPTVPAPDAGNTRDDGGRWPVRGCA